MNKAKIEYTASVLVDAGWRSIRIEAIATLSKTGKKCTVDEVISIDGETPSGYKTRTGAKRQRYSADYVASREVGATKIVSKLWSLEAVA